MGQFGVSDVRAVTEPSADRGPRRGSPAGVVDVPDAKVYFGNKPRQYGLILKLTLASGATALGSVLTVSLLESSAVHSVLLLFIKLS